MMFNDDQVRFIRSLGVTYDLSNMTDDEWINLEDIVADYLTEFGFVGEDYEPTAIGLMCESILDRLAED